MSSLSLRLLLPLNTSVPFLQIVMNHTKELLTLSRVCFLIPHPSVTLT